MRVQSLGREDLLEEGMATHSNILAWRIPWTEGPGGLQLIESRSCTRLKQLIMHATPERLQCLLSLPSGPFHLLVGLSGTGECPRAIPLLNSYPTSNPYTHTYIYTHTHTHHSPGPSCDFCKYSLMNSLTRWLSG